MKSNFNPKVPEFTEEQERLWQKVLVVRAQIPRDRRHARKLDKEIEAAWNAYAQARGLRSY
jgi:hypothetical protein